MKFRLDTFVIVLQMVRVLPEDHRVQAAFFLAWSTGRIKYIPIVGDISVVWEDFSFYTVGIRRSTLVEH